MKHEWFLWKPASRPEGITCCRKCGVVKRRDGANADKPCKGPVGVTTRTTKKPNQPSAGEAVKTILEFLRYWFRRR